jgi:hypothetical protein
MYSLKKSSLDAAPAADGETSGTVAPSARASEAKSEKPR